MAKGAKTGGRAKGTPNKATADIKALAQKYGKEAIEKLVSLMRTAESETAQHAAAKELIERGHGKTTQAVEVSGSLSLPQLVAASTGRPKDQ